jgi:16S rRNA (guanine1207-N2)-methyltransferase
VVSVAQAGNNSFSIMMQRAAALLYERGTELACRLMQASGTGYKPRIAVLNGIKHPALDLLARQSDRLVVQQAHRDAYLDLQSAGRVVHRETPQEPFDIVLLLAGRQREQTMGWVAEGMHLLDGCGAPSGGILAMCTANDMGAKGYEKRLAELDADVTVSSKSRCRIAMLHGEGMAHPEVLDRWLHAAAPRRLADTGLISRPGIFSWSHPDPGSRLLLEYLPADLAGCGMDLGCGNGYLSCHVLAHCPGIGQWHAVDADAMALDCAMQNLQELHTTCGVQTHWLDATRERLPVGMGVVLLNPPFHRDKAELVCLGKSMIEAAQQSLQPDGSLFLVANRHLPYETSLSRLFERIDTLSESEGYKVMRCHAVKR